MEAQRSEESERAAEQQKRETLAQDNVKEAEKMLKALTSEIALLQVTYPNAPAHPRRWSRCG